MASEGLSVLAPLLLLALPCFLRPPFLFICDLLRFYLRYSSLSLFGRRVLRVERVRIEHRVRGLFDVVSVIVRIVIHARILDGLLFGDVVLLPLLGFVVSEGATLA